MREGSAYTYVQRVSEDHPQRYGHASGDTNPIHMDEEFAKSVGLDGVILQGLCTMSFVNQAVTKWAGGAPGRVDQLRVRFKKPVRPGDLLTVHGEVTGVEEDGARLALRVTNQQGEEVVSDGEARVGAGV